MPVTVTNRSRALVTVQLNSGEAVHLAPQETSRSIEEFEVVDNGHLAKLIDRRLVALTQTEHDEPVPAGRKRSKPDKR